MTGRRAGVWSLVAVGLVLVGVVVGAIVEQRLHAQQEANVSANEAATALASSLTLTPTPSDVDIKSQRVMFVAAVRYSGGFQPLFIQRADDDVADIGQRYCDTVRAGTPSLDPIVAETVTAAKVAEFVEFAKAYFCAS